MIYRTLEPFLVERVDYISDHIALISTEGVIVCRPTEIFSRIPEPGDQLQLECLGGSRVTGLKDGENWVFYYTDTQIAEQDRAMLAAAAAHRQAETAQAAAE